MDAIKEYEKIKDAYIQDGNTLYFYTKDLYYTNRLKEAEQYIVTCKKCYCTSDLYILSASINKESGRYAKAGEDLLTAVYMVPDKMMSRKILLDFYAERKDTAGVLAWCKSIMEMPEKIPSAMTTSIKRAASNIFKQYQN